MFADRGESLIGLVGYKRFIDAEKWLRREIQNANDRFRDISWLEAVDFNKLSKLLRFQYWTRRIEHMSRLSRLAQFRSNRPVPSCSGTEIVLQEFERRTEPLLKWEPLKKFWRFSQEGEGPGRKPG